MIQYQVYGKRGRGEWQRMDIPENYVEVNRRGQVRNWYVLRTPTYTYSGDIAYVGFRHGGKQHNYYIHRLVAAAFLPNPRKLPYVTWRDGDKTNNQLRNLRWTSGINGSTGGRRIISTEAVQMIRGSKERNTILAKRYGVSSTMVSLIKRGKRRVHG